MVVHICCSVDSWYFLQKIREKYPDEELVGFFYNPNIHPKSEYQTRLIDSRRSCEQLGIAWMEGSYDPENWMAATRGLEEAPEKGARCALCFDQRLLKTAKLADRLGHDTYTTTLLMSPKKDFSQLQNAADRLLRHYQARFIIEDFRKGGGTQAQFALAREKQAYKQNYCGCFYALLKQRQARQQIAAELFSPLSGGDTNPCDERLALYVQRDRLEKSGQSTTVLRQRRLVWRLLLGGIWSEAGEAIASEILPCSSGDLDLKTNLISLSDQVAALPRQPGFVVTHHFTKGCEGSERARLIRQRLGLGMWDVTPIFVVEALPLGRVHLRLLSELREETHELLAHFQ